MNRIVVFSGVLGLGLIGCQSQPISTTDTTAAAETPGVNELAELAADRVVLYVSGMACPF